MHSISYQFTSLRLNNFILFSVEEAKALRIAFIGIKIAVTIPPTLKN
jgi:hypothetical protein